MTSSVEPSVNIPLLLRDHLPKSIRTAKQNIAQLEADLKREREELEVLIRHAAVAQIAIEDVTPEPSKVDADA